MHIRLSFFTSFVLILLICMYTPSHTRTKRKVNSIRTQIKQNQPEQSLLPKKYNVKTFDLTNVTGLSQSQLDQHQKLYAGYVNKRNQIDEQLTFVDRNNIANVTYSPFRSLKISQTFARNGTLLHELYFENLKAGKKIQPSTEKLLTQNFGSIAAFKKDLIDCASCSRGWVITSYCIDDGRVKNFVLDAHNETVPILTVPILVVDVYEHAYMIDFGIDRESYLKTLWDTIDWDVVESRINKWIQPHVTMQQNV